MENITVDKVFVGKVLFRLTNEKDKKYDDADEKTQKACCDIGLAFFDIVMKKVKLDALQEEMKKIDELVN